MLPGCATIVTGTVQPVAVESDPPGATCKVTQDGYPLGTILSTPGVVSVRKGSGSLNVACSKPGYRMAEQSVPFGLQGWLLGNAIIGGLVGVVVDFSTGAAFKYAPGTTLALLTDPAVPAMSVRANTNAYASLTPSSSSNPLVVRPTTPNGDVTYVWPATSTP